MNKLLPVFQQARKTAITCLLLLVLAGAALAGLMAVKSELLKRLNAQRDSVQQRASELAALTETRRLVAEGKPAFIEQQAQGLVGTPAREQWVQSLIGLYHERGFQGMPAFKLHSAQQHVLAQSAGAGPGAPGLPGGAAGLGGGLTGAGPGIAAAPGAPGAGGGAAGMGSSASAAALPVVVRSYELEFKLTDAHEDDVLAILGGLQRAHPGLQQAKGCTLEGLTPTGLVARCQVNFFNITRAATESTNPSAAVPGT